MLDLITVSYTVINSTFIVFLKINRKVIPDPGTLELIIELAINLNLYKWTLIPQNIIANLNYVKMSHTLEHLTLHTAGFLKWRPTSWIGLLALMYGPRSVSKYIETYRKWCVFGPLAFVFEFSLFGPSLLARKYD